MSKELNHFGSIAEFFRDWAPGTLTGAVGHKPSFMNNLSVFPVPNLGKTFQSPQSDLTPWTLTLIDLSEMKFGTF